MTKLWFLCSSPNFYHASANSLSYEEFNIFSYLYLMLYGSGFASPEAAFYKLTNKVIMLSASNNTGIIRFKILGFLFLLLTANYGFSQSCGGDLTVEKDRNVRSADEDGTQFSLRLVNTSSKAQTYIISTANLEESCATTHHKTTAPNVNLNVSVLQKNDSPISEIKLAKGETGTFDVRVSVPKGTPFDTWSCIEVQAQAKSCNSVASATLRVFVPDSSEE